MELLRILIKESPTDALLLFAACGLAGISEGAVVLLILELAASGEHSLAYLILLMLVASLFLLSAYLYHVRGSVLAEKAMENMVGDICDRIRLSELPEIEKIAKSDAYNYIWNARIISDAAFKSLYLLHRVISVFTIWIYVWAVSPFLGLILTLFCLFYVLVYEVFQDVARSEVGGEKRIITALFRAFDHILYGFKEVRLNQRKNNDLFENHITPLISETETVRVRNTRFIAEFFRFTNISFMTCACLCALILPRYLESSPIMTVIILYLWEPVMTLASGTPEIIEGKAAMDQLSRLREQLGKPGQTVSASAVEPISDFRIIALENVGFVYGEQNGFSLGPVDLEIRAGEILFVVGGNGSGKSTLIKLICGLYRPSSGQITVDGVTTDMRRHRHLFSAIFTDFHLFDGLYGIESPKEDSVNSLMAEFDLPGRTRFSEGRFSTLDLSAGQKKRLAYVVAMLEGRPVYIFDEWAAEQDPEFRNHFYVSLLPSLRAGGKTVIAVTHDDHYFHIADRVVKLEYGKITLNSI